MKQTLTNRINEKPILTERKFDVLTEDDLFIDDVESNNKHMINEPKFAPKAIE
jgi:hypothetical protein